MFLAVHVGRAVNGHNKNKSEFAWLEKTNCAHVHGYAVCVCNKCAAFALHIAWATDHTVFHKAKDTCSDICHKQLYEDEGLQGTFQHHSQPEQS